MVLKCLNIRIIFKPLFIPTIFLIIVFPILLVLGSWQINRLIWKDNLIKFYKNQSSSNYFELTKKEIGSKSIEFRKVKIKGYFLNKKEIYISGKTYEGNIGFHVVTPFKLKNNEIVLINRGWVSEGYRDPKKRKFTLIKDETVINGIIRYPQKKGYFVPENEPYKGFWFTINPLEIYAFLNLKKENTIKEFYIDALKDVGKIKLPIGANDKPNLRNQHLSYAVTWYSLALILLVVYIFFHHSENRLYIKRKLDE